MGVLVHGHSRKGKFTPEYRAYVAMKNRCLNPNQERFRDYGGRGITICDRWLVGEGGLTGFQCFLADMGTKPTRGHSLDRDDNELGYTPRNCKWATRSQQARNTRANRMVNVFGDLVPLVDAIRAMGMVPAATVRMRIHRGWAPYEAVVVPKGGNPGDADYGVYF